MARIPTIRAARVGERMMVWPSGMSSIADEPLRFALASVADDDRPLADARLGLLRSPSFATPAKIGAMRDDETDDWEDEDDEDDDDGPIMLGAAPDEDDDDAPDLGPDERDMDLMDGSWESEYYSGRQRVRNWNLIMLALGLLVVVGLLASIGGNLFR